MDTFDADLMDPDKIGFFDGINTDRTRIEGDEKNICFQATPIRVNLCESAFIRVPLPIGRIGGRFYLSQRRRARRDLYGTIHG